MLTVKSITISNDQVPMCDLEVEDAHSYYVNGVASHNSGEPVWIETFLNGGDIHAETAKKIWGPANYDKNKRKMAKIANFGCPSRNTYLNTQRGLVHPQDLLGNDRIYDRHGTLQTWKMAEKTGADVINFEFSNGLIDSYHVRHRFLCFTPERTLDWVFAQDLTPSHEIVSVGSGQFYSTEPKTFGFSTSTGRRVDSEFDVSSSDLYFSYFIGLVLGDGCYTRSSSGVPNVVAFVSHPDDVDFHLTGLESLGFKGVVDRSTPKYSTIRVSNSTLAKFFTDLFPGKVFSAEAWTAFPVQSLSAILSGLLDADGKAGNGCLILCNSNRGLLSDVSRIAQILDGYSSIRSSVAGITGPLGRRYHRTNGLPLSRAYELSVYLPEAPVLLRRTYKTKKLLCSKGRWSGFKNLPPSFLSRLFSSSKLEAGGYKGDKVILADNLRSGRQSAFTRRCLHAFGSAFEAEFSLSPLAMPVRVLTSVPGVDSIFTLETSNHEYLSSFLVSHNTLYGGGTFFLTSKLKMTEKEAIDFQAAYKEALPQLFAWTDSIHVEARRRGFIVTPYGVPRRLSYYYRLGRGSAGFADRSAVNTMIQGSAGAIIRLALVKLYKRIADPSWGDGIVGDFHNDLIFQGSVHDEIDYSLEDLRLREFIEKIPPLMVNTVPKAWRVPMEVEVSIGNNWGELVAIDYHDPDLKPVEVEAKPGAAPCAEEASAEWEAFSCDDEDDDADALTGDVESYLR